MYKQTGLSDANWNWDVIYAEAKKKCVTATFKVEDLKGVVLKYYAATNDILLSVQKAIDEVCSNPAYKAQEKEDEQVDENVTLKPKEEESNWWIWLIVGVVAIGGGYFIFKGNKK